MSNVGPELPPHLLAKRKREEEIEDQSRINVDTRSASRSSSSDAGEKRRRIVGPAPPPAPLNERPDSPAEQGSESSSEDEIGPALPPAPGQYDAEIDAQRQQAIADENTAREAAKKPQREEWMLVPPKQDDWSARVDPTKLKNRKFNTGKGSKAPSQKGGGDNTLWTETLEQKMQRLEDEVMGVKKPAQLGPEDKKAGRSEAEAKETQRRIREYNEKNRNTSLYSEHKKTVPKEKEDDPSKRAFDKEKDIGGGMKIGHAQKKEMLNRAADFGSRFAGGNYL
ncbi:MAG: hypothetical protein FRX48_00642 [Lasallia pustulata]|uniref:DUF3752 domain-containing protein n=1 Tax=Lasallia pustulata TaxID=136370 RepID=A0A5M8Q407_9LECA|nr:MAG: hypothetical protein FRX48_00642 [Lasallia pustulata]